MSQPWVAHCQRRLGDQSRGAGRAASAQLLDQRARAGHYVRDEHVLTLPEAVRKMTSLPAQILGLRDRGQIREGFAADIAIFDPADGRRNQLFEKPKSYAKGVPYVLVNGVLVIDKGEHTGARPGKAIKGAGLSSRRPSRPARRRRNNDSVVYRLRRTFRSRGILRVPRLFFS